MKGVFFATTLSLSVEVAGPMEAGGSSNGISWEQADSSGNLLAVGFQTCARVSQLLVSILVFVLHVPFLVGLLGRLVAGRCW